MKFKRTLAVAVAVVTAACSCAFSASAEDTLPSYQKSLNVKAGQVVTVKAYFQNHSEQADNIAGFYSGVKYDGTAVAYTAETAEGDYSKIMPGINEGLLLMNLNPDGGNDSYFSGMNGGDKYDFTERTLFAQLDFDVNTTGVTSFESYIAEMYINDDILTNVLDESSTNMEFLINGYALGDIDTNGTVNIADSIILQKAIAKSITLDDLQESLSDVTGDGSVNIADSIMVQKKISKSINIF